MKFGHADVSSFRDGLTHAIRPTAERARGNEGRRNGQWIM
jgi:hypothetical protein